MIQTIITPELESLRALIAEHKANYAAWNGICDFADTMDERYDPVKAQEAAQLDLIDQELIRKIIGHSASTLDVVREKTAYLVQYDKNGLLDPEDYREFMKSIGGMGVAA